jgi:hypothetical protein
VQGPRVRAGQAAGQAQLLTFTRIYNLPWGFDQRYLTIGVVEFENGVRAVWAHQSRLLKNRYNPFYTRYLPMFSVIHLAEWSPYW